MGLPILLYIAAHVLSCYHWAGISRNYSLFRHHNHRISVQWRCANCTRVASTLNQCGRKIHLLWEWCWNKHGERSLVDKFQLIEGKGISSTLVSLQSSSLEIHCYLQGVTKQLSSFVIEITTDEESSSLTIYCFSSVPRDFFSHCLLKSLSWSLPVLLPDQLRSSTTLTIVNWAIHPEASLFSSQKVGRSCRRRQIRRGSWKASVAVWVPLHIGCSNPSGNLSFSYYCIPSRSSTITSKSLWLRRRVLIA